jgi:hypothetical protein
MSRKSRVSSQRVPKDPRSTQRKRARRILEQRQTPLVCGYKASGEMGEHGCGRSPDPAFADLASGGVYPGIGTLQVNHINKNIMDNDPVNLEYLCASCHKEIDQTTEKGQSVIDDEFGYGESLY